MGGNEGLNRVEDQGRNSMRIQQEKAGSSEETGRFMTNGFTHGGEGREHEIVNPLQAEPGIMALNKPIVKSCFGERVSRTTVRDG
jgi:hypothetical protein